MPAARFDLLGTISGTSPGGGLISPSQDERLTVAIGFERCSASNPNPPFQGSGSVEIFARFSWFYTDPETMMTTAVPVQGFTDGDISILVENDPAVEQQAQLGNVANAGVTQGRLTGGAGGIYYAPLTLNPNSAGEIYVTVLSLSAFTIRGIDDDRSEVYGPFQPATASFAYSTITAIGPISTKPEVDIVVPQDPIFNGATAEITLLWDSDIKSRTHMNTQVGSDADDDIRIEGATYVTDSFMHPSARRMTFSITLSGEGTCKITVKQDSFTDTENSTGPARNEIEEFLFDTSLSIPGTDTDETGVTTIYDSTATPFAGPHDLFGSGGGAFKGVSDLQLIGDHFYGTVQVQKIISGGLDQGEPAKAALFKVPKGGGTLRVLENYNSITESARSIIGLGNRIYAFEGSHPQDGLGNLISYPDSASVIDDNSPTRPRPIMHLPTIH